MTKKKQDFLETTGQMDIWTHSSCDTVNKP